MDVVWVVEAIASILLNFPQLDELIAFRGAEQKVAVVFSGFIFCRHDPPPASHPLGMFSRCVSGGLPEWSPHRQCPQRVHSGHKAEPNDHRSGAPQEALRYALPDSCSTAKLLTAWCDHELRCSVPAIALSSAWSGPAP